MASIVLTDLKKKISNKANTYTYTDLHYDIHQQEIGVGNKKSVKGKDIMVDNDELAIRNSIFNILNTRKYQRILLPSFGANIAAFIGMPCNKTTGEQLGNEILNALRTWEERIRIDKVIVVSKPDEHIFEVTINITIPYLKKTNVKLFAILNSNGIFENINEI